MKKKILFVCHGNICRSAMAEFLFRHLATLRGVENDYEVDSAAVSTEEIGNDIYPPAQRKLREKGVPFTPFLYRKDCPHPQNEPKNTLFIPKNATFICIYQKKAVTLQLCTNNVYAYSFKDELIITETISSEPMVSTK